MNKVDASELLRGKIRLKHLAYSTEQAYCGWVARYCDFVARLDPALGSPLEELMAGASLTSADRVLA